MMEKRGDVRPGRTPDLGEGPTPPPTAEGIEKLAARGAAARAADRAARARAASRPDAPEPPRDDT